MLGGRIPPQEEVAKSGPRERSTANRDSQIGASDHDERPRLLQSEQRAP
jgi:hypothetical protein